MKTTKIANKQTNKKYNVMKELPPWRCTKGPWNIGGGASGRPEELGCIGDNLQVEVWDEEDISSLFLNCESDTGLVQKIQTILERMKKKGKVPFSLSPNWIPRGISAVYPSNLCLIVGYWKDLSNIYLSAVFSLNTP